MKKISLLYFFLPFLLQAQNVTTISSNSGITDALIFDPDGNLLGADYVGSAIYQVNLPDGASSIFSDGYNTPNGLAYDSQGNLYMADNQGNKIYKILPDGSSELFVEMFNPSGIIFEQDSDTLIATSYMGDKLVKIAPDSTMSDWSIGGNLVGGPVGLCYDDDGNLYVGNFDNRRITQILPDGTQVPITVGPTSGALGFLVHSEGYLYGTLFNTHKIFRYEIGSSEPPEIFLGGFAGNTDGGPNEARFNGPNGILASPHGDTLYISDFNSSNIRMVTNLFGTPSSNREVLQLSSFEVSPNPFREQATVSIELEEALQLSIDLIGLDGKSHQTILQDEELVAGLHQFEIQSEALPTGTYSVVIRTNDGRVSSQKIIHMK